MAVIGLFALSLIALAFLALTLLPLDPDGLVRSAAASRPAPSHDEAMAAFATVQAREAGLPLDERCRSTLLTHGAKTGRVVVFLHGLTNCPKQGDSLAARLFALGYNVYLPRLPGHGEADRLTLALAGLTAEDLAVSATGALDLAQGLGEDVVVVGISAGGSMAAWLAQTRADADRVIIIAPYLGPIGLPTWATRATANLMRLAPNLMIWWNPSDPLGATEMDYAYPRYSTRAVGEVMRFGRIIADLADAGPPAATSLGALINRSDEAASIPLTEQLIAAWRRHGRAVDVEILPLPLGLPHDLIDPRQPAANVELVYPLLIQMVGGGT